MSMCAYDISGRAQDLVESSSQRTGQWSAGGFDYIRAAFRPASHADTSNPSAQLKRAPHPATAPTSHGPLGQVFGANHAPTWGYDYLGMSFTGRSWRSRAYRPRRFFGISLLFVFLILVGSYEAGAAFQRIADTPVAFRCLRIAGCCGVYSPAIYPRNMVRYGKRRVLANRSGDVDRSGAKKRNLIVSSPGRYGMCRPLADAALRRCEAASAAHLMTSLAFRIRLRCHSGLASVSGSFPANHGTHGVGGMLAAERDRYLLHSRQFSYFVGETRGHGRAGHRPLCVGAPCREKIEVGFRTPDILTAISRVPARAELQRPRSTHP